MRNIISEIYRTLNESFEDDHVSDKEFKKILEEYQNYLKTSKKIKDAFFDRTYAEKNEMKKKVDELFKSLSRSRSR